MSRVSDILTKARDTLADVDKDRFTDARLIRLLNEAQELIAVNTKVLRNKLVGTVTAASSIFILPEDCINVLRVEWNGVKLTMKSYDEMDALDPNWQSRFGNEPTHVVYDLRLPNKLILWPSLQYSELTPLGLLTGLTVPFVTTIADEYGAAESIQGAVLVNGSPTYGIITTLELAEYSLAIHYAKRPALIIDETSTIELPQLLDTALKQYVVGMALRDNMDTRSREIGAEELTNAAINVKTAIRLLSTDYTAATQYDTTYVGGI